MESLAPTRAMLQMVTGSKEMVEEVAPHGRSVTLSVAGRGRQVVIGRFAEVIEVNYVLTVYLVVLDHLWRCPMWTMTVSGLDGIVSGKKTQVLSSLPHRKDLERELLVNVNGCLVVPVTTDARDDLS